MEKKQRKLRVLGKLLKKLARYNFTGYTETDSFGNLIITIPGVTSVLEQIDREEEKED